MRFANGRSIVATGVALAVAALLVVSATARLTGVGLATDVSPPTDVGDEAEPPASLVDDGSQGDIGAGGTQPDQLPDAGNGGYLVPDGSARILLAMLIAALGITLVGTGVLVGRLGQRVRVE